MKRNGTGKRHKRRTAALLDYLELPFTEQEIRDAPGLVWPKAPARKMAAHFASIAPQIVRGRRELWADWRKHGVSRRGPVGAWSIPAELFPLLTLVSPSARKRVERLMRADWERLRAAYLSSERHRAAVRAGLAPTKRQREVRVRAMLRQTDSMPQGLVVSAGPLPEANVEMEARADRRVDRVILRWRRACKRLARYAERRARGEVGALPPGAVDEISGLDSPTGWSPPRDPSKATATPAQEKLLIGVARARLHRYRVFAPPTESELPFLAHQAACFRRIWRRRVKPQSIARFIDRFGRP